MAITKKSENLKDLKVQEILSYIKASDDEGNIKYTIWTVNEKYVSSSNIII